MPALSNMKRLWVHEILRVFGDRLIDETDIKWLVSQIARTLNERMEISIEELFEDLLPKTGDAKTVSSGYFSTRYVNAKNGACIHIFLSTFRRLLWTNCEI